MGDVNTSNATAMVAYFEFFSHCVFKHFYEDATVRGAIFTFCAFAAMIVLAVVETSAYLASDFTTSIFMDDNPNSQLRINFNITMHDLSCDYASVDLWDTIGTNRQNVTKQPFLNKKRWYTTVHNTAFTPLGC